MTWLCTNQEWREHLSSGEPARKRLKTHTGFSSGASFFTVHVFLRWRVEQEGSYTLLLFFFLYIKLLDPLPLFKSVILSFLILSLWVPAHEIPPMTRSWGENPTGKADQVFRDSEKLPPALTLKMIAVFLMLASIDKKEFIGPGLHLRPVRANSAGLPLQWALNSA